MSTAKMGTGRDRARGAAALATGTFVVRAAFNGWRHGFRRVWVPLSVPGVLSTSPQRPSRWSHVVLCEWAVSLLPLCDQACCLLWYRTGVLTFDAELEPHPVAADDLVLACTFFLFSALFHAY